MREQQPISLEPVILPKASMPNPYREAEPPIFSSVAIETFQPETVNKSEQKKLAEVRDALQKEGENDLVFPEFTEKIENTSELLPEDESLEKVHEVVIEKEPDGLEEGFESKQAQDAYYKLLEAVKALDIKTGDGVDRLEKAMDKVEKHALEMSASRLFMLISVMLQKVAPVLLQHLLSGEDIPPASNKIEEDEKEKEEKKPPILLFHREEIVSFTNRHYVEQTVT
jgi:hypothetical protein